MCYPPLKLCKIVYMEVALKISRLDIFISSMQNNYVHAYYTKLKISIIFFNNHYAMVYIDLNAKLQTT